MRDISPGFKRLLMLQGPAGPFFRLLARRLRGLGISVYKVNFNAGDALFFPGADTRPFRGKLQDWPAFFANLLEELEIDAIALFGDCRQHHKEAVKIAARLGIRVFVFEEGYLRPDHITVELGGVNGHSRSLAPCAVPVPASGGQDIPVGNSFPSMSLWATIYWMAIDLGRLAYPHYRHHRANSLTEASAYLRSGFRKLRCRRRDGETVAGLINRDAPYFLLPLQVSYDSQITEHSPFSSVNDLTATVIRSFARHAPAEATLVIKHHPLDRGHCCYRDAIARFAEEENCTGRVVYIKDGHLPTLLAQAKGTVTCNSTVGLSSLWHGTPVKVLGRAIYDREGLTAQGPLELFWKTTPPVNRQAVAAYVEFLKGTSLANGNFYTAYGRTDVFANVIARMQSHSTYLVSTLRRDTERSSTAHAGEFPAGIPIRLSSDSRKSGTD